MRGLLSLVIVGLLGSVWFGSGSGGAGVARAIEQADTFKVDLAHSTLIYRVRHFGVSNFYGRVNKPKGRFSIDPDNLGSSFVHITVDVENMDAGNEGRNRFLLSPDFFNEREYPTAEFKSSSLRLVSDSTYEATGTFTLHGVTREVVVRLEDYTTRQTDRFGFRAGFECTFDILRSEYGMDLYVKEGTLGDEVRIIAAIEGVRE